MREHQRLSSGPLKCGRHTNKAEARSALNLILLFDSDTIGPDAFRLKGARHTHVSKVLKPQAGDELQVGLVNGPKGIATVVHSTEEYTDLSVAFHPDGRELQPNISLILAAPRPKVFRRILPELAAFGLRELVVLRSWRVERAYLKSDSFLHENCRPLFHRGMSQGKVTHEPTYRFESRFTEFTEGHLGSMLKNSKAYVAHPVGSQTLASEKTLSKTEHIVLAVGPEGGWIEPEFQSFLAAGMKPISLGSRILKVETACAALLGQIELLRSLT